MNTSRALVVAIALSAMPLSGQLPPEVPGVPPAPVLVGPAQGHVLSGPVVRFEWSPRHGTTAVSYFELCIWEHESSCGLPGSRVYPNLPAAVTSFTPPAGLPRQLQGRRLLWTVRACSDASGIPGNPPVRCNPAPPRRLSWPLPAPSLSRPIGAAGTLRPNFAWGGIVGADAYLLCVSAPGVSCPTQPTDTPQTLVLRLTGNQHTPPTEQELARFAGQSVNWTAAACSDDLGCVYQQRVVAVSFPVLSTAPAPGEPVLVSPGDFGQRLGSRQREQVFEWMEVPGAASYRLCLSPPGVQCGTGASTVVSVGTTRHVLRLPPDLGPVGTVLNWTVAACNNAGRCAFQPAFRRLVVGYEDRLRVLTYNTYMRGPERLFDDGQSLRVAPMAAALAGFDVIVLQELFDDSIRQALLSALAPTYPFQTDILGSDRLGVSIGRIPKVQDGGVIIVSRFPIVGQRQRLFGDTCHSVDCSSDKGVLYAAINKGCRMHHVFGTHLQAGEDRGDEAARSDQIGLVRAFIDAQPVPKQEPIIIAGDLNIDMWSPSNQLSGSWRTTLARLGAVGPSPVPGRFTVDGSLNPLANGRKYLDHVLYVSGNRNPAGHPAITIERFRSPMPWGMRNGTPVTDLSDHFAVSADMVFAWPTPGC